MTGTVRISLDFECGWGYIADGSWQSREAQGVYRDLRGAMKRFTARADELELCFSWAVVGAMIQPPNERNFDHVQGKYAGRIAEFLQNAEELTHDGRDLLELVTGMRTRQCFGTHTYSHMAVSDSEQNCQVFQRDLEKAILVNQKLGIDADRLVFPRNHYGNFEAVRDTVITHARMPPLNMSKPGRSRVWGRAAALVARPVSVVSEEVHSTGVVLHHASEFLNWGKNSRKSKRFLQRRRIETTLKKAISGADVHFWLHPFNLAETPGLSDYIDHFLIRLAEGRDRGQLEIKGF